MNRLDRMSSATAAWTLMPGILPFENGVSKTSNKPDAVAPTNTSLSSKDRRIDAGFSFSRICCSESEQIDERSSVG